MYNNYDYSNYGYHSDFRRPVYGGIGRRPFFPGFVSGLAAGALLGSLGVYGYGYGYPYSYYPTYSYPYSPYYY